MTFRLGTRFWWTAAFVVLVVVAVIVITHRSGGPTARPDSPESAPTSTDLRSAPMTGRVTGDAPRSCHERRAGDGQPLPDRSCTPGVLSALVSQANIETTICHPGYTKTIRPPESDTGAFKKKIMAAYDETGPLGDYELDHLVSLELGGSNDAENLWPERNDHPHGAINSKDLVENELHKAICDHKVELSAAQTAIATDWTTALTRLHLPPTTG